MCIRDRVRVAALAALDSEAPAIRSTRWAISRAAVDCSLRPVSYTHLRAHETVLDLVCRLLLEKKKNQIRTANNHVVAET